MPELYEMREAILLIRSYCIREVIAGTHEVVLSDLLTRIDLDDVITEEEVKSKYIDAISTLLILAQPAGYDVFEQTLSQIGTLVGEKLTDVQIMGLGGYNSLKDNLPSKRNVSDYERGVLNYFKSQLPESGLTPTPRRGNDNGPKRSR